MTSNIVLKMYAILTILNFDFRRVLATPSYVIIEMAPIFFGKLQVYIDTLELKFCKNI